VKKSPFPFFEQPDPRMIVVTRLLSLLGICAACFLASCASSPKVATRTKAKTYSALPVSLGKPGTDKACLVRTSPHPGFYKKHGSLFAKVKTTAYSHVEADSLKYGRKNAFGTELRYDNVRSAAADWSVFPVGTLFRIVGQPYTYRIDDYGSALVGTRTIDIYQPTKAGIKAWGSRMVEIEILKWGSYSRSREIMADRSRHPHVRAMLTSITRKQLVATTTAGSRAN
jgi:3D (Asp-Asp-Asp) domain-containing protein